MPLFPAPKSLEVLVQLGGRPHRTDRSTYVHISSSESSAQKEGEVHMQWSSAQGCCSITAAEGNSNFRLCARVPGVAPGIVFRMARMRRIPRFALRTPQSSKSSSENGLCTPSALSYVWGGSQASEFKREIDLSLLGGIAC